MCYEGTMTRDFFRSYLDIAIQSIPPGSIIILDNATCHTQLGKDKELLDAQVTLKYLPPYSPELNKIEKLWSLIKNRLKTVFLYGKETFFDALCEVLKEYAAPPFLRPT